MSRLPLLLVITVAFLPLRCGLAQDQEPESLNREQLRLRALAAEKDAQQQDLVNLEKETARAMQWNSGTFFRRVYGDEFEGILPSGQVLDKSAYIAAVEHSDVKYSSFVASDIRVKMYEQTAIVTCLWSAQGMRNGRSFAKQSRVTHVYVRGQRGWQAVASQETLLPG